MGRPPSRPRADGEATFAGLERALEEGLVDRVGFTGSSAIGSRIGELTGRHLQSACLELGSKNPMVVTSSAELDLAVEAALFSGFGTAGQRSLVGVTTYRDLGEAIRLANVPGYGLSSSIYTSEPAEVFAFRGSISAGMVSVNNSSSGAEAHLPFGGNGKSGNGVAPVGHVGARPLHPVAVDELGLLRAVAEGADGSHRANPRRVVPARRLTLVAGGE